mmetsp:Transcript_23597/g.67630  ORF Transcript_23597/g.67630 Transcript_23597/m.67630 type:complete len:209 (-) Transcript_23597:711-1337(-)
MDFVIDEFIVCCMPPSWLPKSRVVAVALRPARAGEAKAEVFVAASDAPPVEAPASGAGACASATGRSDCGSKSMSSEPSKAKFAVIGRRPESSVLWSIIFERAFSILRSVTLSMILKLISSGDVPFTCGWPVSWRKRHKARITCATSSGPPGGSLLSSRASAAFTWRTRASGAGAMLAATRPSFPVRSRRSRGINLLVFWRSITAVMR